jgi:ABC-2 type transport system permease protein
VADGTAQKRRHDAGVSIDARSMNSVRASVQRICAVVLRHVYLLRKSWPRVVSLVYYPTVTMVLWAFVTQHLAPTNRFLQDAPGFFIGAVLLWDILFRAQLGVSLSFFEELYARNLGNLFVSPLRPWELIAAQLTMSVIRMLIGVGGAVLFAWLLFRYSLFDMGYALIPFTLNLLMLGWAIGLAVCALVLRWGLGAEEFAWAAAFLLAPISGVYYPVAALPGWLQSVAHAVPTSYVFEGMRAVLQQHQFDWQLFVRGALLNLIYLAVGIGLYFAAIRHARNRGALLQMGE